MGRRFAAAFLQIPSHDGHLWLKLMATATFTIPDFHRIDNAHAGRTHLTVNLTVHGPVLTQKGQTLSLDWIGALTSPDVQVMLNIIRSTNFHQFRDALKDWHAPSQNFVYADDAGNIGLISAGYYPKQGSRWFPLPGTSESDVRGTIPFDDILQVMTVFTGLLLRIAGTWAGRAVYALVRPSRKVHQQSFGVSDSPDDYIASGDEW